MVVKFAGEIRARVRPGGGVGVLWVHGYTVDSTTWDTLWSLLPEWSHYGIDLPGHGASPAIQRGTSLGDLGEELANAAAGFGIQHVLGLSVGSAIALEIAMRRPRAFATVTLAAPALAGGPVDRDVGLRYKELFNLYRQRGPGPWMTQLWMQCPPDTFAHASAGLQLQLAAVIDRYGWCDFRDPELGMAPLMRQRQDAQLLALSTARPLIMIGEHELSAFRQTAALLCAIRPDARFTELPGAGHLCLLHEQREAARLLAEHWGA